MIRWEEVGGGLLLAAKRAEPRGRVPVREGVEGGGLADRMPGVGG